MEDFEFEPETNIDVYLKESINVEILERIGRWREVATGETYDEELVSNALDFLNELYHGFSTFKYYMDNPGVIEDVFTTLQTSCRYIDTLVHYYKIGLTPLGERSLDIIEKICEFNGDEFFSDNYTQYKLDGIVTEFKEISTLPNTKQKLIKLITFRSKVETMYFMYPYKATQNAIIEEVTLKINNMEKFHSLGLLADDNYIDNQEIDKLTTELKTVNAEIKNHRLLLTEKTVQLEKERDLHSQTKAVLNITEERLKHTTAEIDHLTSQLNNTASKLQKEQDLHSQTKTEAIAINEELKNAKAMLSQLDISSKISNERLALVNELNKRSTVAFHGEVNERVQLQVELKKTNNEKSTLSRLLNDTRAELQRERVSHIDDDGMIELTVLDRFRTKKKIPAAILNIKKQEAGLDNQQNVQKALNKPTIKTKPFPAYILHEKKEQFAEALNLNFQQKKVKPFD